MTASNAPTHAERCRTLLARARHATLCTLSRAHDGYPFGSLVAIAAAPSGRPLMMLSALAEHTQNLSAHAEASLVITETRVVPAAAFTPKTAAHPAVDLATHSTDSASHAASHAAAIAALADPLANGRVTLIGSCKPIAETSTAQARDTFLAVHPEASVYASFKDFSIFELDPIALRYVGGFGRMSWVDPATFAAAEPDPLHPHEAGILEHMNADHADAVLACARTHGGAHASTHATMIGIDRYGADFIATLGSEHKTLRIPFEQDITTTDAARRALVALTRSARAALGNEANTLHARSPDSLNAPRPSGPDSPNTLHARREDSQPTTPRKTEGHGHS